MTEQSAWLRQQIDQLASQQSKFTDRAFWLALKQVVAEQDRRSCLLYTSPSPRDA